MRPTTPPPFPARLALAGLLTLAALPLPTPGDRAAAVCTLLTSAGNFASGTSPAGVALGDFNGDGIMDLATTTSAPFSIRILPGQGAAGVGNGTFGAATSFALATGPRGLCVGDFNHDGILDLAAVVTGSVSVLLGQGAGGVGNGTFGAAVSFAVGTNPQQVITLDLNEDGILDLVTSNAGSNSVSVLLGAGSGGVGTGAFAAAVNYAVGTSPGGLCAADFNTDGILDVAVANNSVSSNSISVLLGQGAGGVGNGLLGAATNFPCGNNPTGLAVGDFNEDAIYDLAAGTNSGVSVLLGNGASGTGDGTFGAATNYAAGSAARALVVADFNEDDIADVAVTNNVAAGTVSVLLGGGAAGVGNGTFQAPVAFAVGTSPTSLAVGELSEDGHADLVVGNSGSANATALLGSCPGGLPNTVNLTKPNGGEFATPGTALPLTWSRGTGVISARVELSRDGGATWQTLAEHVLKKGLTWQVTGPATSQALMRISDDAVPSRQDVSAAPFYICDPFAGSTVAPGSNFVLGFNTADFNKDGILDLCVVRDSLCLHLGQGAGGVGDGTFAAPLTFSQTAPTTCRPQFADLNRDGILDLVVGKTNGVTIREGLGTNGAWNGGFGAPVSLGSGNIIDMVLQDFNEDGLPEIACVDAAANRVTLLRLGAAAGTWTGTFTSTIVQSGGGAERVATGDFNEDGRPDLLVTNGTASTFTVYAGGGSGGHGDGTLSLLTTVTTPAAPRGIATGDFNENGIPDVAISCPDAGVVAVYLGPGTGGVGTGLYSAHTDYPVIDNQGEVVATDYDRDGIADLAALTSEGGLQFLRGSGTGSTGNGTFSATIRLAGVGSAAFLAVADWQEDGRPDYLVSAPTLTHLALTRGVCSSDAAGLIAVTAPVAGDRWDPGTEQTIAWIRSNTITAVDVELSRDGGGSWEKLARDITGTQFTWTVTPPGTRRAQVRVIESDTQGRPGLSGAFFSLCDTFEPALVGPTPGTGADLLFRDFDHDGYLDCASVTGSVAPNGKVVLVRGQGAGGLMNGTFGPATLIPLTGGGANGLTVGDFNADGIDDLVAATTAGLVQLPGLGAGGVGNGTFDAPTALSAVSAYGVRAADLNEDGILDLVSTDAPGTGISVRLGQGANGLGNGLFGAATVYPAAAKASRVVLGDFNEDGITDVAATSNFSGTPAVVYVFLGQGVGGKGDGTFGPVTSYATNTNSADLVTGDFNEDGITDLAVGQSLSTTALVFPGLGAGGVGNGAFGPPTPLALQGSHDCLVVCDFNHDGIADLAANDTFTGLALCPGLGTGTVGSGAFGAAQPFVTPNSFTSRLVAGDFQEDGVADLFGLSPDLVLAGICPGALPTTVGVLSPNGGESFEVGSEQVIQVTRGEGVLMVDLELSRDGGAHWTTLARNLTETNFKWTVTPPVTGQALLRATDSLVRSHTDASNAAFAIVQGASDVPLPAGEPAVAALSAAAPNPARGPMLFTLTAPARVEARVEVFDLAGRRVRALHAGALEPGAHALTWDGLADDGRPAAQGLYFVRASWPGFEAVRKVARIR